MFYYLIDRLKQSLVLLVFGMSSFVMSQDFSFVNEDDGISYDTTHESTNIVIPLYNVKINGATFPITLSYDNTGTKVSDIPSSVGYNWSLLAGGQINSTINHLPDYSENGWFNSSIPQEYTAEMSNSILYENHDAHPDYFSVSMSNGDNFQYLMRKNYTTNGSFYLSTLFMNPINDVANIANRLNEQDEQLFESYDKAGDIEIKKRNGINYIFRSGVKRKLPYDLKRYIANSYMDVDTIVKSNFYLHKVFSDKNTDFIDFKYKETILNKYIMHTKATRSIETERDGSKSYYLDGYHQDISVEDISRKEIKEIITNKIRVEFIYKKEIFTRNLSSFIDFSHGYPIEKLENQQINLLDQINIFDNTGNYIKGFSFEYTQQTQNQEDFEGLLRIKRIFEIARNKTSKRLFREFNYNVFPTGETVYTQAKDFFDYPNGAFTNNQFNQFLMIRTQSGELNRRPNLDHMKKGVLKSILTPEGKLIEYLYKINEVNGQYYGGLLVDKIITYDGENKLSEKEFIYEEPEGFYIPIDTESIPNISNDHLFSKGYFDNTLMQYPWQTLFTEKDPQSTSNSLKYNLYDSPVELVQNTTLLDQKVNELNLEFSQIKSGSFYRKISSSVKNIHTNTFEKGSVVNYYEPSLSGFYLDKNISKTEYLNSNNQKVKETTYTYSNVNLTPIQVYEYNNVHLNSGSRNTSLFRYVIEPKFFYGAWEVIRSSENTNYSLTGENILSSQKIDYTYVNENSEEPNDYTLVKEVITSSKGKLVSKQNYVYYRELVGHRDDLFLYIANPIIQTNNWIMKDNNWLLNSSSINEYRDYNNAKVKLVKSYSVDNSNLNGALLFEDNFSHSYYDNSNNLIIQPVTNNFIEFYYDSDGKLLGKRNNLNSVTEAYQKSEEYDGLHVDAILTTNLPFTSVSELFIKKSFENSDESDVVKVSNAFSGDYVFNGNTISLGEFPAGYLVSYWKFSNDKWNYVSLIHNGGAVLINKPTDALYIDEIRVQPPNSSIQSFTMKPQIGYTSKLNNRGEGERVEYDIYGNTMFLFDKDKNVLQETRINKRN
ncbi:hypothetical protein ACOSP6_03630 [Tenacibaculum sp. MEBiC06402]|uniref:hypothetical protein n=1 Tax=unclassified Tenacibaculum TaxID=2635139 RepID=UPI003B9DA1E2